MAETLRRSNWPAHETSPRRSQLEPRSHHDEDPLAELERLVARGGPFTSREPPPVHQSPSNVAPFPAQAVAAREPAAPAGRIEPSFGVEERAFEEALAPARRPAQPVSAGQDLDPDFLRGLDREIFGDPAGDARADHAPDAGRLDPLGDESVEEAPASPRRDRGRGGFITIVAVLGLVVLGFGGAIAFALMNRGERTGAEPVIVRADDRPTRVVPPPAPQASAEANDRLIFERGAAPAARSPGERVVSREEQPVEMPQRSEVRVVTPGGMPQGADPPRRVTTTTIRVRPDGTLESEPTRPAPRAPDQTASITPAAPPAALAAPAAPPPAAAPPVQPAPPITAAAPATPPAAAVAPAARTAPTRAPTATANGAPLPLSAPPPQRTASVEPAARAPAPSGNYVQLTSQRSESAARNAFGDIARQYSSIIGSRQPDIRRVDLGERGTFYRARVGGFATRDEAAQFCTRLRAAGGACVVATN
jgi:hypothetical protein